MKIHAKYSNNRRMLQNLLNSCRIEKIINNGTLSERRMVVGNWELIYGRQTHYFTLYYNSNVWNYYNIELLDRNNIDQILHDFEL